MSARSKLLASSSVALIAVLALLVALAFMPKVAFAEDAVAPAVPASGETGTGEKEANPVENGKTTLPANDVEVSPEKPADVQADGTNLEPKTVEEKAAQEKEPAKEKASEEPNLVAAATATVPAKTEDTPVYTVERKPEALTAQATAAPSAGLTFQVHVQNIGDQGWRSAGVGENHKGFAGTTGRSLRMESLQFKLTGNLSGSVQYQVHVQNDGWQTARADGARAGTTGRSLRLEGLSLALVGEVSRYYDVCYRVHVQNDGWQGWKSNGQYAGTTGRSLRLEAIEVYLRAKSPSASPAEGIVGVVYQGHVQNVGWQDVKNTGGTAGTSGQSLRVEALKIWLNSGRYSGGIEYNAHVQNIGWQGWNSNGAAAGTTGRSLRLEAIEIELTGDIAQYYDVYYRTHVQNFGWLDWAKNGQMAGTSGMSYRMEALQITLVKKNGPAPGPTAIPSTTDYWGYLENRYLSNNSVKELLEVRYTGGTRANIVLRQKQNKAWKTVLSCQGYVGAAGIGDAYEGSTRTPEGDFGITRAFGINGNPGSRLPYVKVTNAMYWCSDSSYYNQLIDIYDHPHWCTGEHLIDYSPDYDYGLFFDYNTNPVVYGKGSAFFVHCKGRHDYTAGCISMSESNMVKVIRTVSSGARLIIHSA